MNHSRMKEVNISLSSVCLFAIVLLSFLYHNIIYALSVYTYFIVFAVLAFVNIVSKRILNISHRVLNWAWVPAMLTVLVSYYGISTRAPGAQVDVLILVIGMIFCMFSINDSSEYLCCIKILVFMGTIHSIGVIIQRYIPVLHRLCISILPSYMRDSILLGNNSGFETNSGFTAAFISIGIIALIALTSAENKIGNLRKVLLLVHVFALLLTGKRAHPLFLAIALLLCYLMPSRGEKRLRKYWNIFIIFTAVVILFFLFKDVLSTIPFISSVIETIDGLMLGEDITSSRTALFTWAWRMFLKNPVFGIGWGDYRTTVVGNLTYSTDLDAHNIYLQLLCETGIVGFLCFAIPFAAFWVSTKNAYCRCVQTNNEFTGKWKSLIFCSFAFQTFFLLYGLSGNPLYDTNWQIMYMVSCGITLSYLAAEETHNDLEI